MLDHTHRARIRRTVLSGGVKMATEGKRHEGQGDDEENPYTLDGAMSQTRHVQLTIVVWTSAVKLSHRGVLSEQCRGG